MITMSNVMLSYGFEKVLDQFSMTVYPGEKVGLIGANGSGKSTVFKLIVGQLGPDQGTVAVGKKLKLGHLAQIPQFQEGEVARDWLYQGVSDIRNLEGELRKLETDMGKPDDFSSKEMDKIMKEYSRLSEKFEQMGGYTYPAKIDMIVQGLGIEFSLDSHIDTLSGGERARLQMARLLLSEPDVLLLDEPTNHLDFSALRWLEGYIKEYEGTVLIISHDRYFLDNTIERLVEINHGQAEEYAGNYSYYLEERERRFQLQLKKYLNQQKKIKQKEESIERLRRWGTQADNEKFFKRAKSMEKQLEKMEKIDHPDKGLTEFDLNFDGGRSGKEVIIIEELSKGYDDKQLLKDIDLKIFFGQRIGLIGPNGSGKTTLLKMLLDQVEPDQGQIRLGASVKVGYLDQQQNFEDPEQTILSAFRKDIPPMHESRARGILAKYGFPGQEVFKEVKEMSGGERIRLHLAKLVYNQVNLLILDEPTNHLDLPSIEILEEAILDYQGTLVVVSHDRFFLNKVINGIYAIEGEKMNYYPGNYDDYRQKMDEKREAQLNRRKNSTSNGKKNSRNDYRSRKEDPKKKKRDLEEKLEEIELKIVGLENKIEENQQLMLRPENLEDYQYLNQLKKENQELERELVETMDHWESIGAELEAFQEVI